MRVQRLSAAIAATVLIGAVQIGVAPVASASGGLPMHDDIFDMVVDGAHDHVFVSSGPGENSVAVLDYLGSLVVTLSIDGASGMALVGTKLFVAAADADNIAVVDTTTTPPTVIETLSIGTFTHPESIAYVADTLWFTTGTCGTTVQQAHIDTDGTNLSSAVTLSASTCPRYATSPADANLLLMFDEGVNPTTLYEYDMSTGPPTLVTSAVNPDGSGNADDAAFAPAGASFFTASETQSAFAQVKTSDLTAIRAYPAESPANAVDVTATSGGRLAGGSDSGQSVWVYDIGTSTATNSFDLPGDDAVVARGVAWSDDGALLFVVAHRTPSSPVRFYALDPLAAGSALTLSATPGHPTVGDRIRLAGTLTFDDGPVTGLETILITRTDAAGTHKVGQAYVGGDGSYHLHDTARVGGQATYEASFDGSDHHKASTASDTVAVNKLASHVSIKVSDRAVTFGHAVRVTGHLGPGTQSRVLELFAKPDGGHQTLVRKAKVDRHGNLSASVRPGRDTTFIAHFDGDLKHRSAQDSAVTRVRVVLNAKLTKFVATSGKYKIYRGGTNAPCQVHVSPNHAGYYVHVTLQGYVSGHWKVFDIDAFQLNAKSNVAFYMYGTSNVNFRVKAKLPTHTDHLGDASPWLYFRFK
jgi:hypothetical protein